MHYNISDFLNSLNCGDIYFFHGNVRTPQKHYQLILNKNPNTNTDFIFLSIATTNIDGRKRYVELNNMSEDTFVVIEVGEISCLDKKCCFDCNTLQNHNIYDLHGLYLQGKLTYKDKMPKSILDKIFKGIKLSDDVSDRDKRLILQ